MESYESKRARQQPSFRVEPAEEAVQPVEVKPDPPKPLECKRCKIAVYPAGSPFTECSSCRQFADDERRHNERQAVLQNTMLSLGQRIGELVKIEQEMLGIMRESNQRLGAMRPRRALIDRLLDGVEYVVLAAREHRRGER